MQQPQNIGDLEILCKRNGHSLQFFVAKLKDDFGHGGHAGLIQSLLDQGLGMMIFCISQISAELTK
ncbi:8497_t:CDS:2 [Funneliformis caledonium]|uniref:8497_t:CDS:1 n=1 Tax=Funneliformis caledonium TaxID=1117310 RepID=A0A9N8ZJX8_9GLOM|nr:8497_t:CDS:2 [Funneliformis caledonium]